MNKTIRTRTRIAFAVTAAINLTPVGLASRASAEPGGCLKYGAAGAVGGHLSHHGLLGAAGGCVTGMVVRHRYRKHLRADANAYRAEQNGTAAGGTQPD